jgi:hypothetical protein
MPRATTLQGALSMTKSEAKTIEQRAGRALRNIEGTGMPWSKMPAELQQEVLQSLQEARSEVTCILEMALAELHPGK